MDDRVYWIWAQQAFPPGSPLPAKLAGQYEGGLREFYEGGPKLWNSRRDLKEAETSVLWSFSLGEAEARLEYAAKVGWWVITPESRNYPDLLRNIPTPPAVLYGKGKLPDPDRHLPVAVVGARKALPASREAALHFGYQLGVGRACVISGGAAGIDAAALSGALRIPDAKMISVLPVSLDSAYLRENSRLRAMICERGGALVTEYFSQQNPLYGTFPVRNRLITGLSRGVVVIQAARKSGSMIYATHAADQNRDLFVYPGPENAFQFEGSRKLLEDGAIPVTDADEVLSFYRDGGRVRDDHQDRIDELFRQLDLAGDSGPEKGPPLQNRDETLLEDVTGRMPPGAGKVWEALGPDPADVGTLAERTGMTASALLGLLTELELEGLAESHPGKRYSRGRGL